MSTLYPVSWQGAAVPSTKVDVSWGAKAFQTALVSELTKAGIDPRIPVDGGPDLDIVIRSQIVRADPGNRFMRWMFSFLAGAAVFEVQGQVGEAAPAFGSFHATGPGRVAYGGGNSQQLLTDAGRLAGEQAAKQI